MGEMTSGILDASDKGPMVVHLACTILVLGLLYYASEYGAGDEFYS